MRGQQGMRMPCQRGSVSPQHETLLFVNNPHVWLYPHEMAVKVPKAEVAYGTAVGTLVSLNDPVCAFPALPAESSEATTDSPVH